MSIKIIRPGALATVQGAARSGYRGIGVGSGGAMDSFAMKVANYLCGNEEDQAAIEINFPSPEILFEQDAIIALSGADLGATVNDKMTIPVWRALFIKKGAVLKFKRPVTGTRAYLAIYGGWHAGKWLNSYSTHLKLGIGGHQGRALQAGDIINFHPISFSLDESKIFSWNISKNELDKIYLPGHNIRCIRGVEYGLLDEASKKGFEKNDLIISSQSDRMGYRLSGKPLSLLQPMELISSAVDTGTVQLLPDGNCIILMADHQTTGGYPRIASVIKADIPKLVQLKPGQPVNFTMISQQEAEDAFIYIQKTLKEIKAACHLNLEKYL